MIQRRGALDQLVRNIEWKWRAAEMRASSEDWVHTCCQACVQVRSVNTRGGPCWLTLLTKHFFVLRLLLIFFFYSTSSPRPVSFFYFLSFLNILLIFYPFSSAFFTRNILWSTSGFYITLVKENNTLQSRQIFQIGFSLDVNILKSPGRLRWHLEIVCGCKFLCERAGSVVRARLAAELWFGSSQIFESFFFLQLTAQLRCS